MASEDLEEMLDRARKQAYHDRGKVLAAHFKNHLIAANTLEALILAAENLDEATLKNSLALIDTSTSIRADDTVMLVRKYLKEMEKLNMENKNMEESKAIAMSSSAVTAPGTDMPVFDPKVESRNDLFEFQEESRSRKEPDTCQAGQVTEPEHYSVSAESLFAEAQGLAEKKISKNATNVTTSRTVQRKGLIPKVQTKIVAKFEPSSKVAKEDVEKHAVAKPQREIAAASTIKDKQIPHVGSKISVPTKSDSSTAQRSLNKAVSSPEAIFPLEDPQTAEQPSAIVMFEEHEELGGAAQDDCSVDAATLAAEQSSCPLLAENIDHAVAAAAARQKRLADLLAELRSGRPHGVTLQGWLIASVPSTTIYAPRFFRLMDSNAGPRLLSYPDRTAAYCLPRAADEIPLYLAAGSKDSVAIYCDKCEGFASLEHFEDGGGGMAPLSEVKSEKAQGILKIVDAAGTYHFLAAVSPFIREKEPAEPADCFPVLTAWKAALSTALASARQKMSVAGGGGSVPRADYTFNPMSRSNNLLEELGPHHVADPSLPRLMLESNLLERFPEAVTAITALRTLCLGRNRIRFAAGNALAALTGLVSLSLDSNRLAALPAEIGCMTALTLLRLDANDLVELPVALGGLCRLRELWLQSNRLVVLPEDAGKLVALERLFVGRNRLRALPASCGGWTALQDLWAEDNELADLPTTLSSLVALQTLVTSRNRLQQLPAGMGGMSELTDLRVDGNLIADLRVPDRSLFAVVGLRRLHVQGNRIGSLSGALGNLLSLTDLRAQCNRLDSLPARLGRLGALCSLNLANNLIRSVPPDLGRLTALTELFLGGNPLVPAEAHLTSLSAAQVVAAFREHLTVDLTSSGLSTVPADIALRTRLQSLILSRNLLEGLPGSLARLHSLRSLMLGHNRLCALDPWVGGLHQLTELELNNNRLLFLPHEIGRLTRLAVLSLEFNPVCSLPCELGRLTGLRRLGLEGCPLRPPVRDEYEAGGFPAVVSFLASL